MKRSILMGTIVIVWLILSVILYFYIYGKKHYHNDIFITNGLKTSAFIDDSLNNYELNMVYQLYDQNRTIVNDQLLHNQPIERNVFHWQGLNECLFTILSIGMFCAVVYYSFAINLNSFIWYFGLSKFMFWIMWYRMEWINMNQVHMDNVHTIEDMIDNLPQRKEINDQVIHIKGDIKLNDISFKTNEGKIILSVPNLHIPQGSKVAIHGKSGSGKSTLLYLISRQIESNSGIIEIDGTNIHSINNNCFYNQIGYISQNNCYFNNTVEYNLKLGKHDATIEELKHIMSQVELDHIDLNTSITPFRIYENEY